jgi:hypothetical protein
LVFVKRKSNKQNTAEHLLLLLCVAKEIFIVPEDPIPGTPPKEAHSESYRVFKWDPKKQSWRRVDL